MSTVDQTLALLRFLANAPAPAGVNAISRELGMPPSSCFRILKQLAGADFARFDPVTKCYSLGSAAVMLARRALDPANTFEFIQPYLTQFVAETQTSLGFWRRIDRTRIVLSGFIEAPHFMRLHMSVGQRLPLFVGAVGRAFAAEFRLSDNEIRQEFSRLRWQAAPDFSEYRRQVEDYCRVGYATDFGNFAPGVTTVATVLRDAMGDPAFGLSAIQISGQIDANAVHEIGCAVVRMKEEINRALYGREPVAGRARA